MRRICYSVAMSLDGYVAGPNGESDWILFDPEIDFAALFARFDTLLMGRHTYEAAQAHSGGGMSGIHSVVVSSTLQQQAHPDVTVIGADLRVEVEQLRTQSGKDIWLFGGGTLFRSLLELQLVDTVEVAIIPVLLGGGRPLLPPRLERTRLRLVHNKIYPSGIVGLEYVVT